MSGLTLIDEYRLNREGRKILERVKKIFSDTYQVNKVEISSKEFDILRKAVFPSFHKDCDKSIVFCGKSILRGK